MVERRAVRWSATYLFTNDDGTECWTLVDKGGKFFRNGGNVVYFKHQLAAEEAARKLNAKS